MNELRRQLNEQTEAVSNEEKIETIIDEHLRKYHEWKENNPDREFDQIPGELYPIFIPKKLWELTENPSNVRIIKGNDGGGIYFYALESVMAHRDMSARINTEWARVFKEKLVADNEDILMRCHMFTRHDNADLLYVHGYDAIEHKGIGTEFYTELLPKLAKDNGVRFITGKNNDDNITFFTDPKGLGRYRFSQIKPEFQKYLFPDIDEDTMGDDFKNLYTIQFLFEEDKDKYLI